MKSTVTAVTLHPNFNTRALYTWRGLADPKYFEVLPISGVHTQLLKGLEDKETYEPIEPIDPHCWDKPHCKSFKMFVWYLPGYRKSLIRTIERRLEGARLDKFFCRSWDERSCIHAANCPFRVTRALGPCQPRAVLLNWDANRSHGFGRGTLRSRRGV
jgi:hypothetical protein